ncbi:MAG: tautomerase family protein [Candidatus Mucispirillum faecigallinarum]|nr:tautomerase family protein [Candidatus Mucispirillum faecigallinarum]
MAHISIDLPSISQQQKKKLIEGMQALLSEIAEIDKSEISVSLHELPRENMNSSENNIKSVKEETRQEKKSEEKEVKKKSFFKEIFP